MMSLSTLRQNMPALAAAFALATIVACQASGEGGETASTAALETIRPAVPFQLEGLDGRPVVYDAFDDEGVIMLNFWASWCGPCRAEVPDLIELHEEYEEEGLRLVGVTVNDLPKDSREFAEELEMPYELAIGTPKMLEEYAIAPWLPTTLLMVDGNIVEEWVGPRVRADFEYSIRVALGLAPPISDVVSDGSQPQKR